jgi:hypothetical protein
MSFFQKPLNFVIQNNVIHTVGKASLKTTNKTGKQYVDATGVQQDNKVLSTM